MMDPGPTGFDLTLEAVRKEMDIEPGSPEQMMEERIARFADESINLAMLALDPEQKPLIEREWRGIAQVLLRTKLMMGVFNGDDIEPIRRLIAALDNIPKPGLRVIRNG